MTESITISVNSHCHFVYALLGDIDQLSDIEADELNGFLAELNKRCGPRQPLSRAISQTLAFEFLGLDGVAPALLRKFSDDDLEILARQCGQAEGMFAMQEALSTATQKLKQVSRADSCPVEARGETDGLLHRIGSLSNGERNALCDVLLRLQANDALTVDELRTDAISRTRLLAGK